MRGDVLGMGVAQSCDANNLNDRVYRESRVPQRTA